MKTYWDSSAIIVVAHDETKAHWLKEGENYTRPHALAEMFSSLTNGRFRIRYSPHDAVKIITSNTERLGFVELDKQETLATLAKAGGLNVHGGHVHDLMHAAAAAKVGADRVFTIEVTHFEGLATRVINPEELECLPGEPTA